MAQLSSSPERMEVLRRTGGSGGGGGCGGGRTVGFALLSAGVALVLWWIAARALAPQGQPQLLSSRLVHAAASGRLGGVGPRLEPWAHNRSCLVYILDASAELAPAAGVPQCHISDPEVRGSIDADVTHVQAAFCTCSKGASPNTQCLQVWPHGLPGRGVTAMNETPHYAFQHAASWWLTQALRNASGLLTTNMDEACMVWLDMCASLGV